MSSAVTDILILTLLLYLKHINSYIQLGLLWKSTFSSYLSGWQVRENKHFRKDDIDRTFSILHVHTSRHHLVQWGNHTGLPDQTAGLNPRAPFQPHWQGNVAFCPVGVISKLESVGLCLFGKHLRSTNILNSK